MKQLLHLLFFSKSVRELNYLVQGQAT